LREIAEGDAPAFKFPLAPSACLSFLFRFPCLPDPLLFEFCHLRFWDEGMKINMRLILLSVSLLVSSVLPPVFFFSFFLDLSVFLVLVPLYFLSSSVSWFFCLFPPFSPSVLPFSPLFVRLLCFFEKKPWEPKSALSFFLFSPLSSAFFSFF
jgi:hypothetical protein